MIKIFCKLIKVSSKNLTIERIVNVDDDRKNTHETFKVNPEVIDIFLNYLNKSHSLMEKGYVFEIGIVKGEVVQCKEVSLNELCVLFMDKFPNAISMDINALNIIEDEKSFNEEK